ncbi:MAG TPA: hypothetical protein VKD71_14560 [Gemmataceae bacterium]|nr:hypothetical protein [Gemmataceae bacterium]
MNTTNKDNVMNGFRLLINGKLVEAAGTLDVINPATGRVVTSPRAHKPPLEEFTQATIINMAK